MEKLKIEYLPKQKLKPYANNAKVHSAEQVEQIKKSIMQFGFNDPIAIWHDNEVVEGHGRLLAVMEMDEVETIPVIRLDSLSDEQRKAYALAHNKLTMNSGFDFDLLQLELDSLEIDMTMFGFDDIHLDSFFSDEEHEDENDRGNEGDGIPKIIVTCKDNKQYAELLEFLNENSIQFKSV